MKSLKQIGLGCSRVVRSVILLLVRAYCRALPASDLSMAVQLVERGRHLVSDCSQQLSRVLAGPIVMLDVGARGGLQAPFDRYAAHIEAILVEPDPIEAARLASAGHRVVDKALGACRGTSVLHVLRHPAASSLLPPNGPFMDFYAHGSDRYDLVKTVEVETVTVDEALAPLVDRLDVLKLDTQGTELDILKGLGRYRPLIIQSEVSLVPIYSGQCMLWDVAAHLWAAGYVPFDQYVGFVAPGPRQKFRPSLPGSYRGLPAAGDILMMPDWTRPEGLALIRGREREFAALCLIFGMENILRYILARVDLDGKDAILKAL